MLVDQIEHVRQSLIILLSGEEVDYQLTRMKQCQVQLTRATEMYMNTCESIQIMVLELKIIA